MSASFSAPKRVAIVGGGISGLAAAFELSDPRHQGQFQVSLYQLGWRMGGKCASGRDLDAGKRIKEHGPHIFFGFYDNGIALLQEAYDTLAGDPTRPFKQVFDALEGLDELVAMDQLDDGTWAPWAIAMPERPGLPGDPLVDAERRALVLLHRTIVHRVQNLASATFTDVMTDLERATVLMKRLESTEDRERMSQELAAQYSTLQRFVRSQAEQPRQRSSDRVRVERLFSIDDDALRRDLILANLALAFGIGMLQDGLIWPTPASVQAVNSLDLRAWLRKFGALDLTAESAIVRAIYDTVFAYPGGDVSTDGDLAAGSAVLACKGIISYRGSVAYKMRAGTGDVVAAPFFQVLQQRQVPVHYFHRMTSLASANGSTIDTVTFGVQATTLGGAPYEPLITLTNGLQAWPDRPLYNQLVQGAQLAGVDLESDWSGWQDVGAVQINAGSDFDVLITATPLEVLRNAMPAALPQAWTAALAASQTVPTASVQLWFDKSASQSGWTGPDETVASALDEAQLDTWLDSSQVLDSEEWALPRPAQMAILCGPLHLTEAIPPPSTLTFPQLVSNTVLGYATTFLNQASVSLWPDFSTSGTFDWNVLRSQSGYTGAQRLQDQVWVGAVNASDRYVLSPSGDASAARLAPDGSGYGNLFLCGDWTGYGYDLGFFEGAIISGLMAANAISGNPRPILREPFSSGASL